MAGNVKASLDQRRVLNRMCVCHDLRIPKTIQVRITKRTRLYTDQQLDEYLARHSDTWATVYVRLLHMCAGKGTQLRNRIVCIYTHLCVYVCMYVRMYLCMYARMYVFVFSLST